MKIRKDFVTNSSSSSYICNVCGREESGYDLDFRDFEFVQCENGHLFCTEHINLNKKDIIEYLKLKDVSNKEINEIFENIKTNQLLETLDKWYTDNEDEDIFYNFPSELCPICQMKECSFDDINDYKNVLLGKSNKEIFKLAKEKFKTYKEFHDFLESELKKIEKKN